MTVILMGPPGAGKGTQANALKDHFGLRHVSTGDILRAEVKAGTDLGKKAQDFMDRGELVPDEIVINIIDSKLKSSNGKKGYLFDGFPRTREQAIALGEILEKNGIDLVAVLNLDVPEEELLKRILSRVDGRQDDDPEIFKQRIDVYHSNTRPLISYYREMSKLKEIDGHQKPDSVFSDIKSAVGGLL